jgi:hypothetical protein
VKSRDAKTRYKENHRHEQKALEDFAAHEIEYADDLLLWYRLKKLDIPDDEYRGVVFFKNREFRAKPGSLSLLLSLYQQLNTELPGVTRENAFFILAYRYKVYAIALAKGRFSGPQQVKNSD